MFLDICLGNRTTWKIISVMAEAPGKALSRKEIKEFTKLGNKGIDQFMDILQSFELIKTNKLGKRVYYKLNLNNLFLTKILELIQLEKERLENLDLKVIMILREMVYGIGNLNENNIQKVILFGSYAKRTFNEKSDVDIAIVLTRKNPTTQLLISELGDKLKKRFGKDIQIHYFEEKEFSHNGKLVEEIKKDGIVLLP